MADPTWFRYDLAERFKIPYPNSEHEVRVMCGDPVASVIDRLDKFLKSENPSPRVELHVALDCLWLKVFAHSILHYDIVRGSWIFPEVLPDELYFSLLEIIKMENHHD